MASTAGVLISGIIAAYGTTKATSSFLLILSVLIFMYRPDIADLENRVQPVSLSNIQKSYDFVIIGGGSAGSVLANRLSENSNCTVLLIEAGQNEPDVNDVPAIWQDLYNTPLDWQFKSLPSDKYCVGLPNHQCTLPRGKVLGGSSATNAMVYMRGNKKDYDTWEEMGNPGWNYENVLPYFKKSEDMRIEEFRNSTYHQTGGYLSIEYYKYVSPVIQYLLKAGTEMGYDITDVNGANQTGFALTQATVRDGLRCSTAKAYLRSAWRRKNLHIIIESRVEKILLRKDENSATAYGVQFRSGSEVYIVEANREVILSAGAIQSPQLLMLSGIGPKEHLEEFNIPVIHDAPGVGENYQDHLSLLGMYYQVTSPPGYTDLNPFTFRLISTINTGILNQFAIDHTGQLYASPLVELSSFIFSKYANKSENYPDIQVTASGANADYGSLATNKDYYLMAPILVRPRSRGYIKLNSAKIEDHPIIFPNFFDDPRDLDVMVEGMQFIYNLSKTSTMQQLEAQPALQINSECSSFEYLSIDYWRCFAKYQSSTFLHESGTCKMGPASDKMAVVDARLKVHGVSGLRVIDTSIFPTIPSGNTNAPVIMTAEKAADMIKEDWNA